jgi:hypothetical protein
MRRLTKAQNAESLMLKRKRGGILMKEEVLAFAENPETALHSCFEWDDTVGGAQYRLIQAAQIVALTVDVIIENRPAVRAFVSLSSDRTAGGGFRRMRDVLDDDALRAVLLEDALAELRLHQDKYRELTELAKVWQAAEAVEKQTARKHRRKAA